MKFINVLILIGGLIMLVAVIFVGVAFILQQEIPVGASLSDKDFIQVLVNFLIGGMILLFGVRLFNNSVDAINK